MMSPPTKDSDERVQFLLAMYNATWDNINRHILVVWQSIAALFTALGAAYLSAKASVPADLVASLVILAAGWAVAIAIDAGGWYNRNLLIISNIEKQFLLEEDLREIHFYFGRHRSKWPIDFLQIQLVLGTAIALLALLLHFRERVWPGLGRSWALFDMWAAVPYLLFLAVGGILWWFAWKVNGDYTRLKEKSPGRDIGDKRAAAPTQ